MKHYPTGTAAAALMALSGAATAAEFKMGHVRPQDATIDVELRAFAEDVAEATGGDVTIEIFPASALGDYTTVQERISVGAVDMATQPAAIGACGSTASPIWPIPGTRPARSTAPAARCARGWPISAPSMQYHARGLAGLFRGHLAERRAGEPGRYQPVERHQGACARHQELFAHRRGAGIPSQIPVSEAFTAIQTGVVDGVIRSGAEGCYASFRNVTKACIPAHTDAGDQAAPQAAADGFEVQRWTMAEEDQGKWEQRLADELGTNIVELTDDQLAAMAAKDREEVWPVVLEGVGVDWGQAILDRIDKSGIRAAGPARTARPGHRADGGGHAPPLTPLESRMDTDYAIIGGGLVGLSVALRLLRRGPSVTVIDGDDGAFRASRGNFGLVRVQSKGLNEPRYARWSQRSAAAWAGFADTLAARTGRGVGLDQNGGYDLHFSEETLAATVAKCEALKERLGGDDPVEGRGHNALRKEEPGIGPKVVGAILHHQDGHANPLTLLMALADDVRRMGGRVLTGRTVTAVEKPDGFRVRRSDGTQVTAGKVVLSAGLGAAQLGPRLGYRAPVRPRRGQVLITEKLPRIINRPSLIARQVDEGGVQIGATNEEVGLDDGVTQPGLSRLAAEAIAADPALARAHLLRSWGRCA